MRFRDEWRGLLTIAAAAIVTVPLLLLTPVSPGSPKVAGAAPQPTAPAAAQSAATAPSDLDTKSWPTAFVREGGGPAPNAGKAQFAGETVADRQFAAPGDSPVTDVGFTPQSGEIAGHPEWRRADMPVTTASVDGGGAPTTAGDADPEPGTVAAPDVVPDDASHRVARYRAARYRADVDTAFHVPIRNRTQEADA